MARKIIWSKTAEKQFDGIVEYIKNEWSEKIAANFVKRTNDLINLLILYPEAGSIESKEKKIRGFLIVKQVRMFYRIRTGGITLIGFFDTRLNPSKRIK